MAKLTVFLTSLDGGGAERSMVNLINGLVQQGITVDLILVKREGPFVPLVDPQVNMIDFGGKRLIASIGDLVNYLKREQPQALLSSLEDTNVVAIAAKHLARVATKVVVNVQNTVSQEFKHGTSLKKRLAPIMVRLFYPWSNAIVPVSQGVADDLIKLGLSPQLIQVIHNPVVTPEIAQKVNEPVTHPWFAPNQPPVIVGVGRLDKQKDFPTLIRALAKVRQQIPARLMILGEGSDRSSLEALVKQLDLTEAVALPGFVNNPYAYMAKASVFVLSSLYEGLPTVLIEAMAGGTPVVATNCPSGPWEILAGGKYGKLVEIGDIQGIAQAIIATLQQPLDSELLKQRAFEFSLEKSIEKYTQILQVN
ncbi:glycosyl transferase group 1 [Stanieria cyanosphaera PCC 7437]|uniref:Glycosyl transferase group 1 n=1 Tax=Stanieria cyanosphaera (strain ATCC 29371 / PCC 7437) TaxID=111780 RepID=K9XS96_STAC7|nr:glycosyltransferase [Stanieria cyanosphaera]AFZ35408.1 glycosyl transferase group 1 [Stanieria cyanosphaera PCC 7437]